MREQENDNKAIIKTVEKRIDKRTLRAIAQEMQLKVALQ